LHKKVRSWLFVVKSLADFYLGFFIVPYNMRGWVDGLALKLAGSIDTYRVVFVPKWP